MSIYQYPVTKQWIQGLPQIPYRKGIGQYEGVVVHYTANDSDTASGEANYESNSFNDAFVDEFIDAKSIIQVADPNFLQWGCGQNGNPRFVQIEMCHANSQQEFDVIFDETCEQVAGFLFSRHLGVSKAQPDGSGTLWSHADVTKYLGGTDHTDPIEFLKRWGKTWDDLISQVNKYYNLLLDDEKQNSQNSNVSSPALAVQPQIQVQPQAAIVENPLQTSQPVQPMIAKNAIVGISKVSFAQLVSFVKNKNPDFNPQIAQAFLTIGAKYNIRGDVAFCQSIHETNFFTFKKADGTPSDVSPSQMNYAGIGATGGVPGNSFATIEDGVTAQIQHLFAYSTSLSLPSGETILDPRFTFVVRGSQSNWENLAGHWAWPGYDRNKYASLQLALNAGESYGQSIIALYYQMLNYVIPVEKKINDVDNHWAKDQINDLFAKGIVDGDENGNFNPDKSATRAEVAVMLDRVLKYIGK